MTTPHEMRCTVCRATLPPGANHCPGCGLQLVASAAPVVQVKTEWYIPAWGWAILAIVVIVIIANIARRGEATHAADSETAFAADIAAGKLSEPAAFQSRCSAAKWTHQTKQGIELQYPDGADDVFATFTASGPKFELGHSIRVGSQFKEYRTVISAENAFHAFGCDRPR